MSHEREGGTHIFTCDKCGDYESDDDDFLGVWEGLKDEGWISFKDDGGWTHLCPVCKGAPW